MVAAVRIRKGLAAAAGAALLGLLGPSLADAQATSYAGKYKASPTTVIAEVSAWGEDCGKRPQSQTLVEQPVVEVREVGAQLELKFPDRVVRSNGCWSQNPAVKLIASTGANGEWKAECATAQGDSKRELGRYTINASSPTTLELREESEYLWQLKTSRCTAKVRTVQKLERTSDGAVAQPMPTPLPDVTAPPCVPGPLARIKVRPQDARIQPGQRVCFSVRAFDANGCGSELETQSVEWSLEKTDALRGTLSGGCFRASESTAEAEGVFRISASREGKRDQVSVTVAIADLSDITARRDQEGSNRLATEDSAEGGLAGAGVKAVTVRSGQGLGLLLAGMAALVMLGSLGWWLLSRRHTPAAAVPPERGSRPTPQVREHVDVARSPAEHVSPAAPIPSYPPAAAGAEQMICPQCRRGYPPSSARCLNDGTPLITYASFVQQSKASERRTCAGCGERLDADAAFCGSCGKRV